MRGTAGSLPRHTEALLRSCSQTGHGGQGVAVGTLRALRARHRCGSGPERAGRGSAEGARREWCGGSAGMVWGFSGKAVGVQWEF